VRLIHQHIAYEEPQIITDEEIAFFQYLVETETCWQLPWHYQHLPATFTEAELDKATGSSGGSFVRLALWSSAPLSLACSHITFELAFRKGAVPGALGGILFLIL
jgi:hypothetical protein